jgi:hypothetical protein
LRVSARCCTVNAMRALCLTRIIGELVIATALFWVLFLAAFAVLTSFRGVGPAYDVPVLMFLLAHVATFPAMLLVAWLEPPVGRARPPS